MSTDEATSKPTESTNFGLSYDAWGRLVLIDAEGCRHVGVEPVRSYPLSDPSHWVSICDPNGREILCGLPQFAPIHYLLRSSNQHISGTVFLRELPFIDYACSLCVVI